jgi:hypothetical protein
MAREKVGLVWRVGGEGVNRGNCLKKAKQEACRPSSVSQKRKPVTRSISGCWAELSYLRLLYLIFISL